MSTELNLTVQTNEVQMNRNETKKDKTIKQMFSHFGQEVNIQPPAKIQQPDPPVLVPQVQQRQRGGGGREGDGGEDRG